jgi:hypothetical protein
MKRPKPLTPPAANLRGSEPPWETFVEMAMDQFGMSREDAEKMVAKLKAQTPRMQ